MCGCNYAFATELDEARVDLDTKVAELELLTAQLEEAQSNVETTKNELDTISVSIINSQDKLIEVQKNLAAVSRLLYKADDLNFLQILTSSQNIPELIERLFQLEAVAGQAANLSAEEKAIQEELSAEYKRVTQHKDDLVQAQESLEQTKNTLDESIASLQQRIEELEEAEAREQTAAAAAAALKAAEEAARQAADIANTGVYNAAVNTAGATETPSSQDTSSVNEAVDESPASTAESYPTQDTSGWSTGLASAYGGSSDPSTPNPGTTATGALCDDYSVGVAVPLAWGPAAYYGRMVEISYNGTTVVATVNDCGGMGGGARALDLQPGVFKAFGFATCQDWGVREVQYRFL